MRCKRTSSVTRYGREMVSRWVSSKTTHAAFALPCLRSAHSCSGAVLLQTFVQEEMSAEDSCERSMPLLPPRSGISRWIDGLQLRDGCSPRKVMSSLHTIKLNARARSLKGCDVARCRHSQIPASETCRLTAARPTSPPEALARQEIRPFGSAFTCLTWVGVNLLAQPRSTIKNIFVLRLSLDACRFLANHYTVRDRSRVWFAGVDGHRSVVELQRLGLALGLDPKTLELIRCATVDGFGALLLSRQ
jgi:hypothetical protein